ncbi:hypothetical protein AK51_20730 [Serratia nematodiphila DZ0503SBS1]|nr:hypothetical protein AK51_20730 [Serratia nematodiphila DZ0503SBS1]
MASASAVSAAHVRPDVLHDNDAVLTVGDAVDHLIENGVHPAAVDLNVSMASVNRLAAVGDDLNAEVPVVGQVFDKAAMVELVEDFDAAYRVIQAALHPEPFAVGEAAEQGERKFAQTQRFWISRNRLGRCSNSAGG